eukprot:CAMPEP_0119364510 /NCGR_PEP_ID=MMETSP1334-20130426/11419_1 /TAXON_ID=127549 /ORGANISM="Calcidiscus leptoporus, Strain RCC1130" /LENGTH=69 /DNA_ID=CAMNT_0007380227 /DNA_START=794 /DNA_END=1000 /DNA_ORIENTATION=-
MASRARCTFHLVASRKDDYGSRKGTQGTDESGCMLSWARPWLSTGSGGGGGGGEVGGGDGGVGVGVGVG